MEELTIEELKKQLAEEKKKVAYLEAENSKFKLPGKTKLYHSLNRNMNDLADMLNKVNLTDVNLDDPKDRTFERMKIIWAAISPVVETIRILGQSSGINTGDETGIPFAETFAETRR